VPPAQLTRAFQDRVLRPLKLTVHIYVSMHVCIHMHTQLHIHTRKITPQGQVHMGGPGLSLAGEEDEAAGG
jgi:hypothetical protein